MEKGERHQLRLTGVSDRPALDHVLLDWNGTLLADTTACWKADNEALTAFGGRAVDMATFRETLEIPLIGFYVRHGCERTDIEAGLDRRHRIFSRAYETGVAHARTRRGCREMLAWLGSLGIQRVVLSNESADRIMSHLARLGMVFEVDLLLAHDVFGGVFMKRSKEDKLSAFLASTGSHAGRVAIVGDSPEEVEIGLRAGIWTIAVSGGEYSVRRLRAAQPHFLVRSLHGAIEALRQIGRKVPHRPTSSLRRP
jgi:phosphoglycolate phosphatase-like HAD superfamily hydrolase